MKKNLLVVSILALIFAGNAVAQESFDPITGLRSGTDSSSKRVERTFGPTSEIGYMLNYSSFNCRQTPCEWATQWGADRYRTSGDTWQDATVNLPTGAQIESLTLDYYDSNPTENMTTVLFECTVYNTTCTALAIASSSGDSGDSSVTVALASPVIVKNFNRRYFVRVGWNTLDASNRLYDVVVGYKLVVSEPPPAATFTDVPIGHPFRKFIEALVSSGILPAAERVRRSVPIVR